MDDTSQSWDRPPLPPAAPDDGDDLRGGWTQRTDGRRQERVASVLDSSDPGTLDAFARDVATDLDAPVALVSIVGRDAQEFAGAYGLSGWLAETRGTPLEWSFCRRVVGTGKPYVVADAVNDAVQRDNPLVLDGTIGSYVGVPLQHDGEVVGALCVLTAAPREVDAGEVARLTEHAARLARRLGEPS